MEDQVRAAAVTRSVGGAWIVSPAFDLLFLANVLWPLALVPALTHGPAAPLTLWQIYFLTLPHRWLTLLLVAADPDRREGRHRLFVALAVAVTVVVLVTYLCTGDFTCLIFIDLVWNGWHFGSQHAGVLRMYSRKQGGGWPWLEKHGLRFFIFYVALRVPTGLHDAVRSNPGIAAAVSWLDLVVLALPLTLLAINLSRLGLASAGKLTYLLSVCTLYAGLLLAVRRGDPGLVLGLALASAIFHATEYLAIVTHYAWKRREVGSPGLFRTMAANWLALLVLFAVGLGTLGAVYGTALGRIWIGLNLVAAFLHYTYDGLIWKLRRPETARALGLSGSSTPA